MQSQIASYLPKVHHKRHGRLLVVLARFGSVDPVDKRTKRVVHRIEVKLDSVDAIAIGDFEHLIEIPGPRSG